MLPALVPQSVRRAAFLLFLVAVPLVYFSSASAFRSAPRDETNQALRADLPDAQSSACFNAAPSADPSATVCITRITVPFNGTSPENQFYVSWRSLKSETG